MIHPFYGYLTAFPNIELSWKELVEVYKNQIASSYEKSFGNDLLGEEICCLSYWLLADPQRKGWLSCQEAVPLFLALKFNNMLRDHYHKPEEFLTIAKLSEEFDFNLRQKRGEFIEIEGTEDTIIRFDFMRDIFLERGL